MSWLEKFSDPALTDVLSIGEKIFGSVLTMIIGMGITFAVLILLWLFVSLIGRLTNRHREIKQEFTIQDEGLYTALGSEPGPEPAPRAVSAEASAEETPEGISADILAAVIAAAVAAYEAEGNTGGLIVRKIRRISAGETLWSNAAKTDCIESRKIQK